MTGDVLPAATVPVALDEAKAFLRIADANEDALIAGFIRSATALAEAFTGQRLIARDVVDGVLPVGTWQRLGAAPVVAITSVAVGGVPLPGAMVETDIDTAGNGWVRLVAPDPASRPQVTYRAGLAADWNGVPEPLRQGIVRLVSHFHAHRDAPDAGGPPAAVAALWRRGAGCVWAGRLVMPSADEFTGGLRETVGIDQWVSAIDGVGGWIDAGVAWAALVPVDPTVIENVGERAIGRPRYRLTLRLPTMASVTSRFRWRDRRLAILRAEPDPRLRDRLTFLVEDRT